MPILIYRLRSLNTRMMARPRVNQFALFCLFALYAIGWLLAVLYAVPPHSLGMAIIVLTLIVMAIQFPLIAKQTR